MAENLNEEIKKDLTEEAVRETDGEEIANGSQEGPEENAGSEGVQQEAAEDAADVEEKAEGEEEAPAEEGSVEKGDEGRDFAAKDKKDEKIEELTDRLTRQIAEFDNYRKRTEKEKTANYVIGAKDVIEKLLPVIDNFERGLADADLSDPFAEGMDKIYKQFTQILKDLGVEPIEAVGNDFDPNFHNAVMHVEDEAAGENVVVEEFQKGYTYKEYVVRHSMVKVAN